MPAASLLAKAVAFWRENHYPGHFRMKRSPHPKTMRAVKLSDFVQHGETSTARGRARN